MSRNGPTTGNRKHAVPSLPTSEKGYYRDSRTGKVCVERADGDVYLGAHAIDQWNDRCPDGTPPIWEALTDATRTEKTVDSHHFKIDSPDDPIAIYVYPCDGATLPPPAMLAIVVNPSHLPVEEFVVTAYPVKDVTNDWVRHRFIELTTALRVSNR